jgi:predicted metal-dependent phosphoesterase TrpH
MRRQETSRRQEQEMAKYYYDTHVHTDESSACGKVPGRQAARLYKAAGYQGIVITDHYTRKYFRSCAGRTWDEKLDSFLAGYREARREGEKIGLQVFLGAELALDNPYNDYLLMGIREDFLREYPKLYRLDLRDLYELAEEHDFLVFQAHPFRPGFSPGDPAFLHGVEVYNGNPRHDSHNKIARRFAEQHRLKMLSGSDFHIEVDTARGGIATSRRLNTAEELLRVLKDGDYDLVTTSGRPFSPARILTDFCDLLRSRK